MAEEIKLVKVEYWRQVKPPSLNQWLYRRAVKEAMGKAKNRKGVTLNPDTGLPIPESALAAKEALKGLTSGRILAEHPEWEQEYYQLYPQKT